MKMSLKDLLKIGPPGYRPSIELAKALLTDGMPEDSESFLALSILGKYADHGYTPTLAEVELWVKERDGLFHAEMSREVGERFSGLKDDMSPIMMAFQSALDQYSDGKLDMDGLILEIAKPWAWMDDSPFWSGTAADDHWHLAKIKSATHRLLELRITTIDGLFDIQAEVMGPFISLLEGLQSGKSLIASSPDFEQLLKRTKTKIEIVEDAQEQMISYGIKVGFLFRDAWWIEKHGEVTIHGYLAQQTLEKAGEGGAKRSSGDRRQRIRYFLVAHAELIARNPILRQDPQEEVAFRALKLAIKKNPAAFNRGRSKKVAVDYWEYIKSDTELFEEYKNAVKTST